MLDKSAQLQQEAVGALGVNLIHAALTCRGDPNSVITHLLDDLDRWRITVSHSFACSTIISMLTMSGTSSTTQCL